MGLEQFAEKKAITYLIKKYWGSIAAVAVLAISFLEPSLHVYEANHPKGLMTAVIVALLTMYHSSAPKDKTKGVQN